MRLLPSTSAKLGLLASLYLSQGLPFGFFTQALPVLLRKQGLSLPAIGLVHLLALPWALKFLVSPLVDRHGSKRLGRRRGYILPLQVLSAAVLLALSATAEGVGTWGLLVAVLVVNALSAAQDVATDGLAVDLLERSEHGWGNGVQVAAYRVGMILGGGLMLLVFDALGWRPTLLCLGALLLVATVPVARFREPPSAVPPSGSAALSFWWTRRGAGRWLVLLVLYKSGEHLATGMLRTFLVDAGLGMAELGWMLGGVGFTAGLAGALAGGGLVNRLGRRRALLAFGALQALAVLLYVLPAERGASSRSLLVAVCALEHLASGMATAALFTAMMEACRAEHAATDYTVQASLVVVATGLAAAVSGLSAQALGYAGHFALAAGVCAVATIWAALTFHPVPPHAPGHAVEVS